MREERSNDSIRHSFAGVSQNTDDVQRIPTAHYATDDERLGFLHIKLLTLNGWLTDCGQLEGTTPAVYEMR
jgi:hypothetical protein